MGEFKTIISANIPVSLASRLKNKTKGTRSRVITRALTNYLDEKDNFDIEEVETKTLFLELAFRNELSDMQKTILRQMYQELFV